MLNATGLMSHSPAGRNSASSYWLSFVAIAICVLAIDVTTVAHDYADFDTYVYYLDSIYHFPSKSIYTFEGLSNAYLIALNSIFRSVEATIVFAHHLLPLIFLCALAVAFSSNSSSWQSLLLIFAMLGPLLALVTLRATPAYFLVAIGVRYALQRRKVAWLYLGLAAEFHISALLAVIPMAILYFDRNIVRYIPLNRPSFIISLVAIVIMATLLLPQLSGLVNGVIEAFPLIAKYTAYTSDAVSLAAVRNLNHYIFFVFITALVLVFFLLSDARRGLNGYVLSSYVIYLSLFFVTSPVAAFRQAPFWLMPMIGAFPWRRAGIRESFAIPFAIFCAGLFYVQFDQVHG